MGHRPVLSRKCWNCHLAFSEKLTKIIKSVIQPVFQTSRFDWILFYENIFDRIYWIVRIYFYSLFPEETKNIQFKFQSELKREILKNWVRLQQCDG